MPRKKHTPDEIINKPREAEVVIAAGSTSARIARRIPHLGADLLPLAE